MNNPGRIRATQLQVGFIGLEDQSAPMAVAVSKAGFALHIWARRPASLGALGPSTVFVNHGTPATRKRMPPQGAAERGRCRLPGRTGQWRSARHCFRRRARLYDPRAGGRFRWGEALAASVRSTGLFFDAAVWHQPNNGDSAIDRQTQPSAFQG